ncbi:glycine reductase operon associated protein GrdX [Clostridium aceticum]|uniref:Glycine reductase operon associated protein GrdX n=1 Tax=Clostridium aceticum TaxID=84022 RepID=A0A0G3W9Z3_9CLOT|nr:GrdX family protein [Clostridium aceticum]AKL94690.1 glycine reductase operon associated protein GrdX [Clostridium aceticum]
MKPVIITNNSKTWEKYRNAYKIIFIEGTYMEVLVTVRDWVHKGHDLLTHPLSGSIKPNETPYKSVLISDIQKEMNMDSLMIIEESIHTAEKFIEMKKPPTWSESILEDFKEVDCRLLDSAMQSITQC